MNHKSLVLLSTVILFSALYNGTMTRKTSTHGREKPEVNCTGTLIDRSGNRYLNIENITIAGLYKQIRVYPKPRDGQQDPTKHRAYLDPKELLSIKVAAGKTTYNKKTFKELEVTRKDGTQDTYLIEANRIIKYDIPTTSGYEEREINIEAVDTITFTGCKKQVHEEENKNNKRKKNKG